MTIRNRKPLIALIVAAVMAVAWAVYWKGQFEELDDVGSKVLDEDDQAGHG